MSKEQDLKALIREDPHWLIRFGTLGMVLVVLGGLVLSTQIFLDRITQAELAFQTETMSSGRVSASFSVKNDASLQKGDSLEVHVVGPGTEQVLLAPVSDLTTNKVWIQLPQQISVSDQLQVNLTCNPKGYVKYKAGRISVFQKWYQSLFLSFTNN